MSRTSLFQRFVENRHGGTGPFLALALIPLMGFTGAAIDYARANATKVAIQAALDSTGLMLSKSANTLTPAELTASANSLFMAQFNRPEAHNVTLTHEFTAPQQGSFALKLTGTATVPTRFASLIGTSELTVSATSEILWGIKRLNLALALDNTGSMSSSGKMAALKTAAHNLLDTLQAAAKKPDDVKVSIIPFATDVNVGTIYKDEPWIDWEQWENVNGVCSNSSYKTKTSCQSAGRVWTTASRDTWNGCVWDRDQNFDVQNTAANGGQATRFRANQATNCPASILPLTNDWGALHAKVDAMIPTGNTNVTIGMAWAWQTLSPVVPMNAPSPEPDLDKVIVLLTDGENTQNRFTTSRTSIDARTAKVCENAKADNVKVYTVRVISGNATLLRNCATKPDWFYDVQNAAQLNAVFSAIAQNLANLRIAK
ncbi:vWA domain-containing protein [Pseudorhodoplanes sp.]|uniref:vWA domain-containing protein n=1 Tax=Pseudorhodoplanes sp. TaxID=1934341 RepID=UPI00391C514B